MYKNNNDILQSTVCTNNYVRLNKQLSKIKCVIKLINLLINLVKFGSIINCNVQ